MLIGIPLKKQAKAREEAGEPKVLPWEAYSGLVFGMVWGLGISVLIFSGIAAIGRAQRAVRRSEAMVSYREKHPGPWGTILEKDLKQVLEVGPPPEQGEAWADLVESSVFAPVVDRVNPLDEKMEKTLTDLSVGQSAEAVSARLAAAGCGPALRPDAAAVLARLRAKTA